MNVSGRSNLDLSGLKFEDLPTRHRDSIASQLSDDSAVSTSTGEFIPSEIFNKKLRLEIVLNINFNQHEGLVLTFKTSFNRMSADNMQYCCLNWKSDQCHCIITVLLNCYSALKIIDSECQFRTIALGLFMGGRK